MIWVLFALMALAVVVALLWPLLRATAATADRADYDLAVFRDQLAEVERDVARGVVTAGEAESARTEIKRRMLAAAKRAGPAAREETPQGRALLTAGVAVAVPFLALGLYLLLGTPQMPADQAFLTPEEREVALLINQLAERMRKQPDDPQGWTLLARSYRSMDRYAEAAEAYRNLMRLEPQNAEGFAAFGETAIAAAGGKVTAEARDALLHALKLDRNEPRAQFYLGLERVQAGENAVAIAIWRALTAGAPADAGWLPAVRAQMSEVASANNIMPTTIKPRHALEVFGAPAQAAAAPATADPTAPNVDALKGNYSADNLEMIQGMVGGLVAKLESDPNNYDGWMLLGRSYAVLKNLDGAKVAYARAIALKPGEAEPKAQLAGLILQDSGAAPSAALVQVAGDIRKADGKEPLALFILGAERANASDAAAARKLWQDATAALPTDAPLRGEIARRLAALK